MDFRPLGQKAPSTKRYIKIRRPCPRQPWSSRPSESTEHQKVH